MLVGRSEIQINFSNSSGQGHLVIHSNVYKQEWSFLNNETIQFLYNLFFYCLVICKKKISIILCIIKWVGYLQIKFCSLAFIT